jgi:HEAT repeat protein
VREIAPWFESEVEAKREIESTHQSIFQEPFTPQSDDNKSEFREVSVPDGVESLALTADLQQALRSNSAPARASAVAELPRVGGENAYHRITAAFDDPAPEVRSSAARALFDLQVDRAAAFTRALREAEPDRRRAIGAAISSSGLANEAISNLTGESRDKTYDAFSLLFLMSKAGEVRPLMRAIEEHPNAEVRLAVIKLLALSGQPEVLSAFRRMAVRGSLPAEVRAAVMEAIYQITSQTPAETN